MWHTDHVSISIDAVWCLSTKCFDERTLVRRYIYIRVWLLIARVPTGWMDEERSGMRGKRRQPCRLIIYRRVILSYTTMSRIIFMTLELFPVRPCPSFLDMYFSCPKYSVKKWISRRIPTVEMFIYVLLSLYTLGRESFSNIFSHNRISFLSSPGICLPVSHITWHDYSVL